MGGKRTVEFDSLTSPQNLRTKNVEKKTKKRARFFLLLKSPRRVFIQPRHDRSAVRTRVYDCRAGRRFVLQFRVAIFCRAVAAERLGVHRGPRGDYAGTNRMNLSLERTSLGGAVGKTRTPALGALFGFAEEASEPCGTNDTRRGGRVGQVPIRGRVEVGLPADPRVFS